MELSEQSIHDVIHPTAAYARYTPTDDQALDTHVFKSISWDASVLNPKNRIDSLDPPSDPLWRIDGCTAFGSQFYAIPLFLDSIPPLRMDVFTPNLVSLTPELRRVLDTDVVFHTRDASRIAQLGITTHIIRILQHWTSQFEDPRAIYSNRPFGSRIVLENIPLNIAEAHITIGPTHHLERQLLSVSSLKEYWGSDIQLPAIVDLDTIKYMSQLHDSVCLVEIDGKTLIFKALTSYTKYLYHELRQLLLMPTHDHVVSRPAHLITKPCGFGGKVAVVGFTLEYHVHGSLRDLIPFLDVHNLVSLQDKIKWSLQLTSSLLHLRQKAGMFYPDLRLDNIVLSASRDIVMVDFEQRGVWCEFAAPEVNAIEYIRLLAIDDEIPEDAQAHYASILDRLLPRWEDVNSEEQGYVWPSQGYNVPWACLTPTEQQACEVYMLGRVLWCIFEAKSAPQRAAVWLSYRWEPRVEFPNYTKTPKAIQQIIDRCTRGRQEGLSKHIVRERGRIVLRNKEGTGMSTAEEVQATARDWWKREIAESEEWLQRRIEGIENGQWNENYYDRPTIRQVYRDLSAFCLENHLSS